MDPSQVISREYQLQAIDDEIKSLEESIRTLRYRRNALVPISSLPTEVITTIFSFFHLSTFTSGKPDPLAWLRVTHVSHQRREIALNQPLFWNHVNFTTLSSAGAAEILARAKTAPLFLEARIPGRHLYNKAIQRELQRCVTRICDLRIRATPWDLRETLESLISPAPTLECLSLSSEKRGLEVTIPETLFGGTTPRLSSLELRNCDISWESPLLKGLRYLDIRLPSTNARPSLAVWLDALGEMPQLMLLTLYRASPRADRFPFDVERTITLPSLKHVNISDSPRDCAFVLAHLDLPALTCLCLKTLPHLWHPSDVQVQELLPYVARHAHGPQDIQPLQSVLIQEDATHLEILAWPVPDIDLEVHNLPTLLATTPPARVALSFDNAWVSRGNQVGILGAAMMATLPLDDLVTLTAPDLLTLNFWRCHSSKWPLLRRIRLKSDGVHRFIESLREDGENPLLPSLKELILRDSYLDKGHILDLRDALMKRVEHGVPLEMLDLRTCYLDYNYPAAAQALSEIVVDTMVSEEPLNGRGQTISVWPRLFSGPFVEGDNSGEANHSWTDDDDNDSNAGGDDDEE
jgi:hypothetical protein